LYTQCPDCATVFRVTATVLRAARGQVRCGVCDATFDAIAFLTENVEPVEPGPGAQAGQDDLSPEVSVHPGSGVASEARPQHEHALDQIAAAIARAATADLAPAERRAAGTAPRPDTDGASAKPARAATPTESVASAAAGTSVAAGVRRTAEESPAVGTPHEADRSLGTEIVLETLASPDIEAPDETDPTVETEIVLETFESPEVEAPDETGTSLGTEIVLETLESPDIEAHDQIDPSLGTEIVLETMESPEVETHRGAETSADVETLFEAETSFPDERPREAGTSPEAGSRPDLDWFLEAEALPEARSSRDAAAAAVAALLSEARSSVGIAAGHGEAAGAAAAADDIPDSALEFNAPVADWDQVFVADQNAIALTAVDIDLGAAQPAALRDDEESLAITGEYPALEPDARAAADTTAAGATGSPWPADEAGDELATLRERMVGGAERRPAAGSDEEPDSTPADAARPVTATHARAARVALPASVVLLALGLGVQAAHYWRDSLAGQPAIGAPLERLYQRLGRPLEPRSSLAAFDVKQWGAASDARPGALRVRASLVNRAAFAQPYPLLRVTFEDRFGGRVALRDFKPAEYLPGRTEPPQLLAAGARADADLSIVDPGAQAVGFELDVCLVRHGVLTCGNDLKLSGGGR
jgi:predicted Zn finger-like uncharacterized protein